jgi:PAS domain S-box-containing protein
MTKAKISFRKIIPEVILFLLILIAGIIYLNYTWMRIEKKNQENALEIAKSIEILLPIELLDSLDAIPEDSLKNEYLLTKSKLVSLMPVNPESRFTYLYTIKNGKIIIMVDSEPSSSPDYSPPGQEFTEADSLYYDAFYDNKEIVTKPVSDRWGTWISVLIPVIDKKSGEVVAVFGMDFNAKSWSKNLFLEITQSSAIILLIFLLFLILILLKAKNKALQIELLARKTTEIALRESETKYRHLSNKMTDVVWLMSIDGKSLFVSPSIESFTGFTVEEYMKQTIPERFTRETAISGMKILEQEVHYYISTAQNNIKHTRILEMEYLCKGGGTKWGELIVTPYHDDAGDFIGIHGVTRDVTQRKQTEIELIKSKEKAEESDRLKSAFLSNMSHEIRTPMNGIMGFASLLRRPNLTGEKQLEYVDLIEKSGLRMLSIINDIIDISKIESGQMSLYKEKINLLSLLKNLYDFFLPEIIQKGLKFNFNNEIQDSSILIETDHDKLYAILSNLIKNAIKFTKTGKIEFGCRIQNSYLEFYVRDTGIGIPEGQLDLIFERFRQGSESHSRDYEGSGLGLAISKAYVEMLGGKIRAESIPEQGSVFYFTIKFNSSINQQETIEIKSNTSTTPISNKLKIIIAEDNDVTLLLLQNYLQSFASVIYVASNGLQVVNICKMHEDADMIFMDIKMPIYSGYEATKQIREFNKDIIIVAQTAYAMSDEEQKAYNAGCNDYISKPYTEEDISLIIQKWFS